MELNVATESLIYYVLMNKTTGNYVINRPYKMADGKVYYGEQAIRVQNGEHKPIAGGLIDAYIFKTKSDVEQYANEYYEIRKVKMLDLGALETIETEE